MAPQKIYWKWKWPVEFFWSAQGPRADFGRPRKDAKRLTDFVHSFLGPPRDNRCFLCFATGLANGNVPMEENAWLPKQKLNLLNEASELMKSLRPLVKTICRKEELKKASSEVVAAGLLDGGATAALRVH